MIPTLMVALHGQIPAHAKGLRTLVEEKTSHSLSETPRPEPCDFEHVGHEVLCSHMQLLMNAINSTIDVSLLWHFVSKIAWTTRKLCSMVSGISSQMMLLVAQQALIVGLGLKENRRPT